MKKRFASLIGAAVATVVMAGNVFAQLPEFNYKESAGTPDFFYDIVSFAKESKDSTSVSVYTKIRFDELQFVKADPGFSASYELVIQFLDEDERLCAYSIQKKKVAVPVYDKTNSRKIFSAAEAHFSLEPGVYTVSVSLMDLDAKKTRKYNTDYQVPEYFSNELQVGEILLADTIVVDSAGAFRIFPNVLGNFRDEQESIFIYTEIYADENIPEAEIKVSLLDRDHRKELKKFKQRLSGPVTPLYVEVSRQDITNGTYDILLTAESDEYMAGQKRQVRIRWLGIPSVKADLDDAIRQMRWVVKKSFVNEMLKMGTEEKRQAFTGFWKSVDPSPGTEENEVMDEYYRRVDTAMKNFGSFGPGWETDRGMVYIILGPPDNVERHPFEVSSKPYEIWFYQHFNVQLYFMDDHGFGEYRLINRDLFWQTASRAR